LAVLLGIFAAWARFGRRLLPVASLLVAPVYVAGKLPIYLSFPFRRMRTFVRTERDAPAARSDDKEVPAAPDPIR
jgi:hypothetical protein